MTAKHAPAPAPEPTPGTVTVGADWKLLKGTASQPYRLTSATLTVDGKPVAVRKGQTVPALRLSTAQRFDIRDALRFGTLTPGQAATLEVTPSVGRGRPRIAGMDAADLLAFMGETSAEAEADDDADDEDIDADDDAAE